MTISAFGKDKIAESIATPGTLVDSITNIWPAAPSVNCEGSCDE